MYVRNSYDETYHYGIIIFRPICIRHKLMYHKTTYRNALLLFRYNPTPCYWNRYCLSELSESV